MEKFVADVHLGKLARELRMLGFDTLYQNNFSNNQLVHLAREEERILLSRNAAFSKLDGIQFLLIENEDPLLQIKQVTNHFKLFSRFQPFTRCLMCNNIITPVEKIKIKDRLERNTLAFFNEFWQCGLCKRIYWKGSHYERMLGLIKEISTSQA